jgi:drug/metabolite transporter (DMT)-like permease
VKVPEPSPGLADRRGFLYVALATTLFSTTPVLIRWAASLTPLEITFWRMVVATITVGGLATLLDGRPRLGRSDLGRFTEPPVSGRPFAVFGLVTALHFLCYIASLSFTSITHSLALVYTAPIFVTLFSALFLHEPIARRKYLGIAVAVAGVGVLAGFEPRFSLRMLLGDLLAVGSAVCFGFYSVIGRAQRRRYPLLTYAFGTYGAAALWLLPAAAVPLAGKIAAGAPLGYSWLAVLSILALGVGPLGIGHTLYNAALRRVHATYVNLIATQEVTGGVLLGFLLLGEAPSPNSALGAVITLVGIALVLV